MISSSIKKLGVCTILSCVVVSMGFGQTLFAPGTLGASSNSNVGIGTSAPLGKLDVLGALRLDNGTTMSNYFSTITSRYDSTHPFSLAVENNTGGAALEVLGIYSPMGGGSLNLALGTTGSVGIGTTAPAAKLDVRNTGALTVNVVGGGMSTTELITTNSPSITSNGTNYIREISFASYNLPISAGVTDSGYRIGLDVENFVNDSAFVGNLNTQIGLWARVGSYLSGAGTIQNSYGVYIDNIDGPAQILNKYGVFQMNPTAMNYFAGSVGIGTQTPGAGTVFDGDKFDVEGGYMRLGYSSGPFFNFYHPNAGPNLKFTRIGAVNGDVYFDSVNDAYNNASTRLFIQNTTGNIGIGTVNPTQKLSVNGAIRAKEVIVDTGWSDYVFDSDYKLAPLSDVERQIKAEKHLSGIPSAKEVAEHGISMGDMQAKLLAKIEELTLHQIEQAKQLSAQQDKIKELQAQITDLRR